MKIAVYKEIPNPLPDFEDKPILQGMYIIIDDEQIKKIGERYFEIMNGRADMRGAE